MGFLRQKNPVLTKGPKLRRSGSMQRMGWLGSQQSGLWREGLPFTSCQFSASPWVVVAPPEVRRPRPTEVILQRGGVLQSRSGRRPRGRGPRLQPLAPLPPCPYKERPALRLGNPVAIPAAQPQSQAPPLGMGAGRGLGGAVAGAEHIKERPIGVESWV